jgi:hypothetical protein
LDTDNSKASIECQIVSTGWFNGRKLDMAKSATVFLQLFVNPDMGFGKSTLVVTDYEVRYDKPELTRK